MRLRHLMIAAAMTIAGGGMAMAQTGGHCGGNQNGGTGSHMGCCTAPSACDPSACPDPNMAANGTCDMSKCCGMSHDQGSGNCHGSMHGGSGGGMQGGSGGGMHGGSGGGMHGGSGGGMHGGSGGGMHGGSGGGMQGGACNGNGNGGGMMNCPCCKNANGGSQRTASHPTLK